MNEKLRGHLAVIYGEDRADSLAAEISARVDISRTGRAAAGIQLDPLSERDAILITYADQVTAPDEAPLATLADFLQQRISSWLPAVHLLPFYPSSSDDGFSVIDYYRVDPAFGDWEDVAQVGEKFALMFDAVFNHASVQGDWFLRFLAQEPGWEEAFFSVSGDPDLSAVVRPRTHPVLSKMESAAGSRQVWTTFSADQADINFSDPRMMLRLVDVFLFYIEQGVRFIRLDAIAFLWKVVGTSCIHLPETHRAVQLFRTVAESVDPEIVIITETNVPHDLNISYFGDGTNEAHMVYNFALPPLVLHTLHTGNADRLTAWAASLDLPGEQSMMFNFLASHDGIGVNPVRGILDPVEIDALVEMTLAHGGRVSEKSNPDGSTSPYELNINYYDALNGDSDTATAIDRHVAAHAILFAMRGVPGLYFHSLFGSRGDQAGAQKTGIPRRINRQKFDRNTLNGKLDNADSRESQIFERLREMLITRSQQRAFHPTAPQSILNVGDAVFAIVRGNDGAQVCCVVNISDVRVSVVLPERFSPLGTDSVVLDPYQWRWISESER